MNTLNSFLTARKHHVRFLIELLWKEKARTYISVLCNVSSDDNKIHRLPNIEISNSLENSLNQKTGILTLCVSDRACPTLSWDNDFLYGAVSVNKVHSTFKIPLHYILKIEDRNTGISEQFNPIFSTAEVQTALAILAGTAEVEEPKKPRHLTLVK